MITVYPYEDLAHADHGWLNARHHFSFANSRNSDRMGFGKLRVINDDLIKAGTGFGMHGHKDMEIITFVRKGAVTHKDSKGNGGRTEAGNVQVMSAGTGIFHSEYNLESEDTNIFQIWIYPNKKGVQPRWDMAAFSDHKINDTLPLLVSGRKTDESKEALFIHQEASIYGGRLDTGQEVTQAITDQVYMLISDGEVDVSGRLVKKGDGLEITDQDSVTFKALTNAEVIIIDVPT